MLWAAIVVLAAVGAFTMATLDYGKVDFLTACKDALGDFWMMVSSPSLAGHFTLADVIEGLFVSLALAALTAFIGAAGAFVLGLFAATDLSNGTVAAVMSVFRAVPTILWVFVFSVAIGRAV